ncbi:MAG TPA: DegT/DnrJ/EryC1/StrS family aminotransferase [Polyangiaceae bacterium]
MGLLQEVWASGQLTNQGPMVQRLERSLAKQIDAKHVQYVANGTLALQLALRALDVTGEVITTPFSYVATTTAILWERCSPVFVDIEEDTFCIDAKKIEAAITPNTRAILATHVYGHPCDVEALGLIGAKHGLKIIYDGAHAFHTFLGARSVLTFGDVTTLSFHATKLFHTIEGGALVMGNDTLAAATSLLRSFGHVGDEYYTAGINAKASEVHAAMGLCLLPKIEALVARRREISRLYDSHLRAGPLRFPRPAATLRYNFAYYPVVFPSEKTLLRVRASLAEANIGTRRYFYPSLNRLPYIHAGPCPIAEAISSSVLCLPLYHELAEADAERICKIVLSSM